VALESIAQSGSVAHRRRGIVSGDVIFRGTTLVFASCVLVAAVLMVSSLVINSGTTLKRYGFSFFTGTVWDPNLKLVFGAQNYIFGTIVTSLVALFLAGSVGVGVALLLVELHLPNWFRTPVAMLVELLAAIPSIVYGVWGVLVLIPIMQSHVDPFLQTVLGWTPFFGFDSGGGRSILTASLVLAVMIIPTVAAISREVIRVVPDSQREAMLALGATRWEMIRMAVLPYARAGIIGALILALGRAVGETMAATMVIGNFGYAGPNLLSSAGTLASQIANQFSEASGIQLSALTELALILLLISVVLNILARLLVWSVSHGSAEVA
jgi:phosphate transport system permease protein